MSAVGDLKVERVDEELPTTVARGKLMFAVVRRASYLTVDSDGGRIQIRQRDFMLGVSNDAGRTWRFLDDRAYLTSEGVRAMFPSFPANIVLPTLGRAEIL